MTLHVREDGIWKPVGGSAPQPTNGWVRPADWLPLPELQPTDQQMSMLVAVTPFESNYLSLQVQGAYQVDWGDGSPVGTYSSSARADHQYHFNDLGAGTWCSRGYRQAVVTVTPTTGTWTSINLNVRNAQWLPTTNTSNSVLDIVVAGSSLNSFTVNGTVRMSHWLEQFRQVGEWNVTNFSSMFNGCYSLRSIPELDASSGTNFSTMFSGCSSLLSIPELDTSSGTNFSTMFSGCSSLLSIPELDASSGINFSSMFSSCSSIQSIPDIDTSSGTSFSSMFYGCSSLQSIPELDTSSCTSFSGMFYGCFSLQSIPELDTSSGTNFSSTFYGCSSLQSIPELDASSGINFSSMFYGCSSLLSIPDIDTSSGTVFSSMFQNCYSLQSIPDINTSSGTSFSNIFALCRSLQDAPLQGATRGGFSFSGTLMSREALVRLFNGLGTASGSQTITISNTPGASQLTAPERQIATNKGWTISG